jgi:hypothetical protein
MLQILNTLVGLYPVFVLHPSSSLVPQNTFSVFCKSLAIIILYMTAFTIIILLLDHDLHRSDLHCNPTKEISLIIEATALAL